MNKCIFIVVACSLMACSSQPSHEKQELIEEPSDSMLLDLFGEVEVMEEVIAEEAEEEVFIPSGNAKSRNQMRSWLRIIGAGVYAIESVSIQYGGTFLEVVKDGNSWKKPCGVDESKVFGITINIGAYPDSLEKFCDMHLPVLWHTISWEENPVSEFYTIEEVFRSENGKRLTLDLRKMTKEGDECYTDMATPKTFADIYLQEGKVIFEFSEPIADQQFFMEGMHWEGLDVQSCE